MKCPACKAENTQGPTCRRCKADLGPLFALETYRANRLEAARDHLRLGKAGEAVLLAREADNLRPDPESAQVLAMAYLIGKDFVQAWAAYRRTKSTLSKV